MIVFTAGGFDPLHEGHMKLLKKSGMKSGMFIVSVARNEHLIKKKGFYLLDEKVRREIIDSFDFVKETQFHLGEDGTVKENLIRLRERFPDRKILFTKGGEWDKENLPEKEVCEKYNIIIADGVVGTLNSSSEIVHRAFDLLCERRGEGGSKKGS